MNCEIPTTYSGLLLNYHYNQGVASANNAGLTTLLDASGNNLNGSLITFNLNGATSNWIAPGEVLTGFTCGAYSAPEINILGNATTINNGDVTPSITDFTDQ